MKSNYGKNELKLIFFIFYNNNTEFAEWLPFFNMRRKTAQLF